MRTEAEILELVRGFEEHTLLYEEWTHPAHLTVATVYVIRHGDDALDRIRTGIQTLNKHFGVEQTPTGGYHETLTRVWTHLIRHHLSGLETEDLGRQVASVIEVFTDKSVMLRYYTRDRIMSTEARYGWIEPDVAALPLGRVRGEQ